MRVDGQTSLSRDLYQFVKEKSEQSMIENRKMSDHDIDQIEARILSDQEISPEEIDLVRELLAEQETVNISSGRESATIFKEGLDSSAITAIQRLSQRLDQLSENLSPSQQSPLERLQTIDEKIQSLETRIRELSRQLPEEGYLGEYYGLKVENARREMQIYQGIQSSLKGTENLKELKGAELQLKDLVSQIQELSLQVDSTTEPNALIDLRVQLDTLRDEVSSVQLSVLSNQLTQTADRGRMSSSEQRLIASIESSVRDAYEESRILIDQVNSARPEMSVGTQEISELRSQLFTRMKQQLIEGAENSNSVANWRSHFSSDEYFSFNRELNESVFEALKINRDAFMDNSADLPESIVGDFVKLIDRLERHNDPFGITFMGNYSLDAISDFRDSVDENLDLTPAMRTQLTTLANELEQLYLVGDNLSYDLSRLSDRSRFTYDQHFSLELPDVMPARKWSVATSGQPGVLSGAEANAQINDTYSKLEDHLQDYLGDPPVSNWLTFGKYASREAGTQIRNIETVMESLDVFKTFDGDPRNDADAVVRMIQVLETDGMIEQGIRMAAKRAGIPIAVDSKPKDLVIELARYIAEQGTTKGAQLVYEMLDTMDVMHKGLVKGNTGIYGSIAPAHDVFLRAESQDLDGIQALRDAGYGSPPEDPQGWVLKAFENYEQARSLQIEASMESTPSDERARMLQERSDLIAEANLFLGIQEQMFILQDHEIFNHPIMQEMLGSLEGTMSLGTAAGKFELLTHGGNWTDFATRMGLQEVPASQAGKKGILAIRNPDGQDHYYRLRNESEPQYKGTIVHLFQEFHDGHNSEVLREGDPRNIYDDSVYDNRTATTSDGESVIAPEMVPQQTMGRQTDYRKSEDFAGIRGTGASHLALERLLDTNNWYEMSAVDYKAAPATNAGFQVVNSQGKDLDSFVSIGDALLNDAVDLEDEIKAREGLYLKIDLPGPSGDDYVQIESITIEPEGSLEEALKKGEDFSISITVRPSVNPTTGEHQHFFTNDATNTFVLTRSGDDLSMAIHGRNEKSSPGTFNYMVNKGGEMGGQEAQWESFAEGILPQQEEARQRGVNFEEGLLRSQRVP